ncbi:MAG: TonB-dependent receptor, partial [Candidatus Cryptobacteroides sp.]
INVTLNGITLNDAESQEVFWVNIPALGNMLTGVQLQRGLGTSANGAGAFGASINMNTATAGSAPRFHIELSGGSFGTATTSVSASTGLTKSGVYASGAFSFGRTDGYIRNAFAKVISGMAVLGWMDEDDSVRLTYLVGSQRSGLTWDGISYNTYLVDRTYNGLGKYKDDEGNTKYYDNETDNYVQHHVQFNYTHSFDNGISWSNTLNYTRGDGYYEQYKKDKKFTKYGLDAPVDESGNIIQKYSDFIIDKSMANNYIVYNSDLMYRSSLIDVTGGLSVSRYNGDHFGNVLWCRYYDGEDFRYPDKWYFNTGNKYEANVYVRGEYKPFDCLTTYLDLQYRHVSLVMKGEDDDFSSLDHKENWDFFNPRAGLTFHKNGHKAYVSAAWGHREPGRSDIKEIIINNNLGAAREELRPEKMADVEIGYVFSNPKVTASANLYFMEYFDMLLQTGRISGSGYAIKENVGRGYRRGIELGVSWQPLSLLKVDGNLTLSRNKLKNFTAYIPEYNNATDWDLTGVQYTEEYSNTTMLMSPSVVANGQVSVTPFRNLVSNSLKTTTLTLGGKFVGKQYWDNTQNADRCIPSYFVANVALSHQFDVKYGIIGLSAYINNALNAKYYADAWVGRSYLKAEDQKYQEEGLFPQAPINFMFKINYTF